MQIGVLGGTGPAGSGLAARLASSGFDVIIGSRSKYRAMEVRDQHLRERWPEREPPARRRRQRRRPPTADVVVIATPWDAAAPTAASVVATQLQRQGRHLDGQRAGQGRPRVPAARPAPRLGGGAACRPPCPESLVAAAFHHVPAKELGDLDQPVESDVLVCSDHPTATATHDRHRRRRCPDLRPLDAGELSNAAPIEAFAAVLLQLNMQLQDPGGRPVHRPPRVSSADGARRLAETVGSAPMRLYDTAPERGRARSSRARS